MVPCGPEGRGALKKEGRRAEIHAAGRPGIASSREQFPEKGAVRSLPGKRKIGAGFLPFRLPSEGVISLRSRRHSARTWMKSFVLVRSAGLMVTGTVSTSPPRLRTGVPWVAPVSSVQLPRLVEYQTE